MRKFTSLVLCFLLCAGQLWAQNRTITGKVVDEKGNPLAGVTVSAKGFSAKAQTASNGTYSLVVPTNAKQIEFSYVGYGTETITIGSSISYSITLTSSSAEIGDVVVTGYARQKKSQYAGSTVKVGGENFKNVPVATFDQMLQGKVPGLTVLNGSGQPGNPASVVLRGPTTILGNSNNPLYILDGVPVEAAVFASINPNDFESVEVLKDGLSMATYGNRGAAGVIVATTKKGTPGKARLVLSSQYGTKMKPQFNYDMMNSTELLAAQERLGTVLPSSAAALPGWMYSKLNPTYSTLTAAQKAQYDRNLDSLKGINTNWDDVYFRTGTFQNYEIGLSGSIGKASVFSNISYYTEKGLIDRSDMKRVTARNNFSYADEKLSFSVTSLLGYTKRNFQESTTTNGLTNPFLVTRITPSYISLYKTDGTFNTSTAQPYYGVNLYEAMQYNQNYNDQFKLTLGSNTSYKINKNISFGLQTGVDFRETQGTIYRDTRPFLSSSSTSALTRAGIYQEALARNLQISVRPYFDFQKTFAEKHDVEFTANAEYLRNFQKSYTVTAYGTDPKRPNTPAATTAGTTANALIPTLTNAGKAERTIESVFGMVRYTYNKKYTVNGTLRYDGTSNLPEPNRFHAFYAFGGVWEMSQENFFKNVRQISSLRLKASYGQSANADNFPLNYFDYNPTYGQGSYESLVTTVRSGPGNPAADWEYTGVTNISLEFSLFKNRVYGQLDWYNKQTTNLYAPNQLSYLGSGLGTNSTQPVNAGTMRNRGFEYIVNVDVVKTKNLIWTVSANAGINRNKILSLGTATEFALGTGLIKVGQDVNDHYDIRWAGVDAATGSPLYYKQDMTLTNDVNQAFKFQDMGSSSPKLAGGFGTSLRYKGFDLSASFSYANATYRVNNLEFFVENPSFLSGGFNQARSLNFWAKPGDIASTQSPAYQNSFGSKYIQDASFLRFRNLTLAYTVPKAAINKMKFISNMRFYLQGQNLAVWTKWKGYDPEDDNNISLSEYPNPRSITAGLEITF